MKRKGFTLVELLAVIAILAILVIIALPNVMNMFNDAKESAFTTELKEVYKVAQQQWIADSLIKTQDKVYVKCSTDNCGKGLDLTGRNELEYYIRLDKSGNVIEYFATDGTYQYSYTGVGLKIEDIESVLQISKIDDSNRMIITCSGVIGANVISDCKLKSGSLTTPGSKIECGSEHFYVLSTNSGKTRMLAAKNISLTTSHPVQTDTFSPTFFSSTPYWIDPNTNEIKEEYTANENYVYDSNSNLYQYVEAYVNTLKSMGIKNIKGELITLNDIRQAPVVPRRESMKRLINIMRPEEYQQTLSQAYSNYTTEEIKALINQYGLQRVHDYDSLTEDEKAIGVLFIYNAIVEGGLLNASQEEQYAYINTLIDEYNMYNNWLEEWIYDGKDYYSGHVSYDVSFWYPWKENWDGGAYYSDQTGYSIRPVIIILSSEIK